MLYDLWYIEICYPVAVDSSGLFNSNQRNDIWFLFNNNNNNNKKIQLRESEREREKHENIMWTNNKLCVAHLHVFARARESQNINMYTQIDWQIFKLTLDVWLWLRFI